MVVNKTAIENDAAVRFERAGDHVRRVGVRAAVGRRAEFAFGIRLHDEPAEIGNRRINLLHLFFPEINDARVERVKGVEAANAFGAAKVDADKQFHAPGTERRRHAGEFRDVFAVNGVRVRVDVVDGTAVDAERRQQARVIASARQVGDDVAVVPKNGSAGVTALDGAVEIVPLIDDPDRCIRILLFIERKSVHAAPFSATG